jgi:long-chain-fatty-acid--CoA ligase ACSBG
MGEICFRGRNKFMGYYKQPEETIKTIDENGYIHSGDEGYLDADGFLFITGRFKELIITAGGENIPPVLIEQAIKERCRAIS